jgi:hypothetical protein
MRGKMFVVPRHPVICSSTPDSVRFLPGLCETWTILGKETKSSQITRGGRGPGNCPSLAQSERV